MDPEFLKQWQLEMNKEDNHVHANPKNSIARSFFVEYRRNRVDIDAGRTSCCFVSTTVSVTFLSLFPDSASSISRSGIFTPKNEYAWLPIFQEFSRKLLGNLHPDSFPC